MKPSADEFVVQRSLSRYGLAVFCVGIALGVALLFEHFHFRSPAAILLLLAVAIASWYGGRGPGVIAGILGIVAYYWYFVEPVRTIYIIPSEIPHFVTFVAFAALLSWFGTVRRRAEAGLRERADLLDLTHDTVFVMDMEGVIKYWNRGAEERYGWTAEQAVGRFVHGLLETVFPAPVEQIKAELERAGRWEGELRHSRKDGSHLVVASRWSLERDEQGAPAAILETNNDITERKRAEEALRRLNRELRAISDCNQTLLHATDEQSLLNEVCRIVREEAGYKMAWAGYAEHDEAMTVRPVAWSGAEEGYLATAGITWADTERGRGLGGTAIRSGKTCCIQDFATDPRLEPWREGLLQRGFHSGIAVPLKDEEGQAFGSLSVYSAQPDAFTPEEIRLLEELAGDMAFGIVNLRSQAARKKAEQEVTLLSFALDHVREAAFLIDDGGRYQYVNEEGCRVLGYTRAQLLGMSIADIDPDFPAERWSDHWRDLKEHGSLSFESRHRTRDGQIFPVEISANYFEYGGRAYNLGLVRDITERKQAEKTLEAERKRMEVILSALDTGLSLINPDMTIAWVNQKIREMFPFGEPVGQVCHAFYESRETICEGCGTLQAFLSGEVVESEQLVPSVGRWFYIISQPIKDTSGRVVNVLEAITDITERKQAEEALRLSEERLRLTLEATQIGIFDWDVPHDVWYASPIYYTALGYEPREGPGNRAEWVARLHPDDRDPFTRLTHDILTGEIDRYEYEARLRHADGSYRWVHVKALGAEHDSDGKVSRILGVRIDITERKRAEEALRRSEAYLAEAQRLTHIGSWAYKFGTDKPSYWSDELFRIWGLDPKEGPPDAEILRQRIHPEDRDKTFRIRQNALQAKTDFECEFRIVLPDETVRYIRVLGHPVLDANGELIEVLGTHMDVTERKRAIEESERLRRLEAEISHVNRVNVLGELTASIAHELNQPIAGSLLNASAALQWLERDPPDLAQARQRTARIIEAGTLASEIIDRLRSLYRKEPPKRQPLTINDVIGEMVVLLRGEATRHAVSLRADLADSLPIVIADRVQIQQVLMNLMLNGIEAMSDRGGVLEVKSQLKEHGQIEISVNDTGPGLPPGKAGQIFDAFFTTKPQGSGMGLAISKSIVESHGGRIWANGSGGRGATFHFTLPAAPSEASLPADVA
ncbi:MAG TPA: PAS domain S-box protein [Terracidiphilus sp.]|nr:PAS domain S-box protein [Terracidiphilus sp.]